MVIIILISTGTYFVFCGVLLIALLRAAARTSADWNAHTLLVTVRLLDAHSDIDRAHIAAGTVPPRPVAAHQYLHARHGTAARPN